MAHVIAEDHLEIGDDGVLTKKRDGTQKWTSAFRPSTHFAQILYLYDSRFTQSSLDHFKIKLAMIIIF
jgi:hypothetical protein